VKISIVTISFNQCQFLKRCMDSVLSQRDELAAIGVELEYIVVDPGSTDGSRELIESYGNDIIRIFEKDQGPADGLNKGFDVVTGDVLGYLNSDDVFTDNSLIYVALFFKQHAKDYDVISGASNLIGPEDEVYRVLYSDIYNPLAFAYSGCILIQPSSFFTKECFSKTNRFNVHNRTNWDGELFVDLGEAGAKFKVVNNIFSGYRIHDESITGSMSTANKMKNYRREMYERITGNDISEYSDIAALYFKYRRKLINFPDTIQRLKGGKSFGRAVK
jgi:glycosyltransferase involved in cell wall biosynthesis